ncbi:hypothetical protein AAX26_00272 [Aliarcobacter thereius]|uniref:Uncharacterized protein n=2 Tax=Aliarcobacter thereius TaxID=544718 RepID=A0A1C0B9M7_9BACT|nr:hypothetical protein [Aliarcobacter thereius]OCL88586.1 hypothetical protein AAX26_00272 [Aliarcobacter thereius]OCL92080.1 hypothetical protein AAX25_00810 [Aliarcobacter thereius]OCL94824.1 hypothetical protein AA347_00263 [Aliarcobacter thereius LMG 24486]OCM00271.1 hypothetical protein AAX29_00269 [Aliarcobacter thereius]QBF15301.1 hypothetical protein ATH_0211 [Aliarcobacter thereius LMG 24486]
MINKLYNLKKSQTEQKLIEKATLEQEIYEIDEKIYSLTKEINTSTVQQLGSISDFMILAMHKDGLRFEVNKLLKRKDDLLKQVEVLFLEIIDLQKESEQYKYILEEEKEELRKAKLHDEMILNEEFIQSKYIRS